VYTAEVLSTRITMLGHLPKLVEVVLLNDALRLNLVIEVLEVLPKSIAVAELQLLIRHESHTFICLVACPRSLPL
jgi:hypothetical protein